MILLFAHILSYLMLFFILYLLISVSEVLFLLVYPHQKTGILNLPFFPPPLFFLFLTVNSYSLESSLSKLFQDHAEERVFWTDYGFALPRAQEHCQPGLL